MQESGIDARGLFKEFLSSICEEVFSPNRGLFKFDSSSFYLIPNKDAFFIYGRTKALQMFSFAGKMAGKAFFEEISIQPVFNLFVLSKMLGKLSKCVLFVFFSFVIN